MTDSTELLVGIHPRKLRRAVRRYINRKYRAHKKHHKQGYWK